MFEDAPNGLEASYAAGIPCILVPDSHINIDGVKDKATAVLQSLEEFVPEQYGLPAYDV